MRRPALFFLTALNMLNFLDRYLVAALLPILLVELSLTKSQGGLLHASFVVGYSLCSPLFGWLGDRVNRPKLMAFGVLAWSLASAGSGLMSTLAPFIFMRVLVGVGEASFGSIVPGYLKDQEDDHARLNTLLGVFYCAIPVGSALGFVFSGLIAKWLGWRAAFLIPGAVGVLLAPMLLRLPERRTATQAPTNLKNDLGLILRSPITIGAIGGYILNSFALNGVATFVTTLGVELGFVLDRIQLLFGLILVITGFAGTLGGGRLAESLARRSTNPAATLLKLSAVSSFIGVPCLYFAFSTGSQWAFLIGCFFAELAVFLSVAPLNTVIVLTCPQHLVTLTQGFTILMINIIGATLGPYLIGLTADLSGSTANALQCATAALFLSACVWWMTASRARASDAARKVQSEPGTVA